MCWWWGLWLTGARVSARWVAAGPALLTALVRFVSVGRAAAAERRAGGDAGRLPLLGSRRGAASRRHGTRRPPRTQRDGARGCRRDWLTAPPPPPCSPGEAARRPPAARQGRRVPRLHARRAVAAAAGPTGGQHLQHLLARLLTPRRVGGPLGRVPTKQRAVIGRRRTWPTEARRTTDDGPKEAAVRRAVHRDDAELRFWKTHLRRAIWRRAVHRAPASRSTDPRRCSGAVVCFVASRAYVLGCVSKSTPISSGIRSSSQWNKRRKNETSFGGGVMASHMRFKYNRSANAQRRACKPF